jgi:hypothetical protein
MGQEAASVLKALSCFLRIRSELSRENGPSPDPGSTALDAEVTR